MSKKLVVSLFAGAVLLSAGPAFAAGIVSGTCDNCHTMHNSQNGTLEQATNLNMLLKGDGCIGCHALGTGNVDGTGKSNPATSIAAPQVDDSANPLNGGYFTAGPLGATAAAQQHNVADLGNDTDTNMAGLGDGSDQPGGTAAQVPGGIGTAGVPGLTCEGCHEKAGHHDVAATVYRMLTGANTSTRNVNYGDGAGAGFANSTRNVTGYDATAMNNFCAECHGTFHTAQGGPDTWTRHPTDVSISSFTGVNGPSVVAASGYNSGSDLSAVVVGRDGVNTDIVMCLSCHLPHGSAYADLLAFDYSTQSAGDTLTPEGCETCHSYTTVGM